MATSLAVTNGAHLAINNKGGERGRSTLCYRLMQVAGPYSGSLSTYCALMRGRPRGSHGRGVVQGRMVGAVDRGCRCERMKCEEVLGFLICGRVNVKPEKIKTLLIC